MAFEFCDGLDNHNTVNNNLLYKWKIDQFLNMNFGLFSTSGVAGGTALRANRNGSSVKGVMYKTKALRGNTEAYFVAWWFSPLLAATGTTYSHILILTNDGTYETNTGAYSAPSTSTISQLELHLLPTGYLELRRNNTVLATATTTQLSVGNWYFLQAKVFIDDTTGVFQLKIGTTDEINYSGDTYSGGGDKGFRYITFATSQNNTGNQYLIDDPMMYTGAGDAPNDFFSANKIITQKQPSGAGSITQGTPSTGSNYACVDEVPPNTTDYVDFSTSGMADTYAFTDMGAGTGIEAVVINTVCRTTGTTNRKYKGRCKSSSSVGYGPEVEALLNASIYYTQQSAIVVDPNTSVAWSGYAAVDAAEFGLEVTV